jgi:hypothetical protein
LATCGCREERLWAKKGGDSPEERRMSRHSQAFIGFRCEGHVADGEKHTGMGRGGRQRPARRQGSPVGSKGGSRQRWSNNLEAELCSRQGVAVSWYLSWGCEGRCWHL